MDYHFSNRELLLLDYLQQHDYVTSKEAANYLSVSKRTIKKDLSRLKDMINENEELLISTPGKGYYLSRKFTFNKEGFYTLSRNKDLILNNYDRVAYLIQRLLLIKHPIKYEQLADELYISVSSLKKDMLKVRSLLLEYNLKVIHFPNYGVRIIGDEYHFRLAISNFFFHSFLRYLSNYNQVIYKYDAVIIKNIERIICQVAEEYQVTFSEASINDLAIEVIIIYTRKNEEEALPYCKNVQNESDFQMAKDILIRTSDLFNLCDINGASIYYLFQHVSSKKIINYTITKEINIVKIISEIIGEIYRNFDIDFSEERSILKAIELHTVQLVKRVNYNLVIRNPSVFHFFREYLFAAKITITAIKIIEKKLTKKKIPIDEYGFYILYFQAMLSRHITKKKKLLILLGNNRSEKIFLDNYLSVNLNMKKYEYYFVESYPESEKEFDLLLTSGKLPRKYTNKQVIPNFNKATLQQLNYYLENLNYTSNILEKYISINSILITNESTKRKVISDIVRHLEVNKYLKMRIDYKFSYQEIGNGIVHIQDLYKIIDRKICLVVILTKPILWEQTVIKMLFLIKTKKDGDSDLNLLCDAFSNLINSSESIQKLYDNPTPTILLEILC
ncbi:BglG family transcription antiterminator [Enterococcus faecalis]|uniref:BglG family transcription antiterminator n=1 Tax=Enterococcus faecalis TaxID=1351 RepID=UPI002FBD2ED6